MDRQRRHERAGELFLDALKIAPADRARWVEQAAGSDAELAAAVMDLLAHDDPSDPFLEQPVSPAAEQAVRGLHGRAQGADDIPVTGTIDGYTLLDVLGEGGSSVVYRAVQSGTTREVAFKLLRPGVASPQAMRRLEKEAEVLARLDHPAIARIFDAGTADGPTGPLPYLVMELVHGLPVTDWADHRQLGIRARVELLVAICDAVDHAHGRGVVHRDLKPENIVVDEHGQPKVLDFGVARVLQDQALPATTVLTNPGQLVGTLAWMSPEQARADGTAIDVRSDVYSLGVIAFRLLAGRMPYLTEGVGSHELLTQVVETVPPRLGTLDARLRGDLDTIVDTCLRKRPADRYASASLLRVDLQRHLRRERIEARPPTVFEQVRRLVLGHRLASAVLAVVLLGLGVLFWQQSMAYQRARARADYSRELDWAVSSFLNSSLGSVNHSKAGDAETVGELFGRARYWARTTLRDQPGLRGGFLAMIAQTYGQAIERTTHGREAVENLRRARELLREEFGLEDDRTLAAEVALACRQAEPLSEEQRRDLASRVPRVFEPEDLVAREARLVLALHQPELEASRQAVRDLVPAVFSLSPVNRHLEDDAWSGVCTVLPVDERIELTRTILAWPETVPSRALFLLRGLVDGLESEEREPVTRMHWQSVLAMAEATVERMCTEPKGSVTLAHSVGELRARALMALGRGEEALPALEHHLMHALDQESVLWPMVLRRVQALARLLVSLEREEQALELMDFAAGLPAVWFPPDRTGSARWGQLQLQRSDLLLARGRPEEALIAILRAFPYGQQEFEASALSRMADFMTSQGRADELELLRALDEFPDDWEPGVGAVDAPPVEQG